VHPLRRLLSKNAGVVAAGSGLLVGLFGVAAALPEPGRGQDQRISRVLFDAAHAGPGGTGPVVSTSMPEPEREKRYPSAGDDWTGTLSSWGVGLRRTGRYVVRTLPPGRALGYGDAGDRLDLRHFDVLVLPAPTRALTAAEVTAVTRWVRDGGGLFLVTEPDSRVALEPLAGLAGGAPAESGELGPPAPGADPLLDGSFGHVPGTLAGRGITARQAGAGRVVTLAGLAAVQDGTGAGTGPAPAPGAEAGWNDLAAGNDTLTLNATEWLAGAGPPS
jgi:hypothetical protein